MTRDRANHAAVYLNRRLLTTGAVLMLVGGVIGFAGMALGGAAVLTAIRRRVQEMEVSPAELAAHKLRQAKEASLAGAQAWRAASSPAQPS